MNTTHLFRSTSQCRCVFVCRRQLQWQTLGYLLSPELTLTPNVNHFSAWADLVNKWKLRYYAWVYLSHMLEFKPLKWTLGPACVCVCAQEIDKDGERDRERIYLLCGANRYKDQSSCSKHHWGSYGSSNLFSFLHKLCERKRAHLTASFYSFYIDAE